MTINVSDEIEAEFRKKAVAKYGKRKGALGTAVNEALQHWSRSQTQQDLCMELLEKGIYMGGVTYGRREELYDRR